MKLIPLIIVLYTCAIPACLAADANPAIATNQPLAKTQGDALNSDREKVDLIDDSNLAEAISRRPDLDFRNVTIDGEVATISLKDIPADTVQSAEVSKAVTPDLDADLRGGGLNLRSRPTYDLKDRVIKLSLDSTRDPILESFDKEGSLTYGRSMGRWGFMVSGSAEKGPFAMETYQQDWLDLGLPGHPQYVLEEQRLFYSRTDEIEYKANGTIDFKLTDRIRLYLKGDYVDGSRSGYRPRLVIRYNKGDYVSHSDAGADVEGARAERYLSGWDTDAREYTLTTGGYLDLENISIDYQLSYNDDYHILPSLFSAKFLQKNMDLSYDLTNKFAPQFEVISGTGGDLNDPEMFRNDWINKIINEEDKKVWLSTANVTFPVNKAWFKGYVKSGFKLRGLDFDHMSDNSFYDNLDDGFTLADVLGDYDNPDMLGGLYDHGPFPGKDAIHQHLANESASMRYNQTRSREESDPNTFSAGQDIYAGYSMVYIDLENLKIIAGLRYEQTELDYLANELTLDEQGEYLSTQQVSDSNSYTNWFPGIHGRYDAGAFSFIGSWSNTISRPNFEWIVPYREVSRESMFIEAGNPDLQPTLYTNYDFAVDYRLDRNDLLSMELFYQTVEDIVYFETSVVDDGPYQGYEYSSSRNGPTGDVYGMRVIWTQDVGKWMSAIEGLSLNARYTHRISETEYPGRPDVVLPMPRRPRNSFEINLSYKRPRLFAQLEFGYSQASLEHINEEAVWRDVYGGSHIRLDFSSSYQVAEGVRFLFDIENITNELRGEDYLGDQVLLYDFTYSPRRYRLGMKFDL